MEGRVWNDSKFRTLSDDAKLVWFLLMTHVNQTMLGAMRASVGSLASDLGWPFERLLKAFDEVLATGMAKHDAEASFLWLPNFLKYNRPENPNVVKAWGEALELLPECAMKTLVWRGCERCVEGMGEAFQKAFKSLGEGYANTGAGTGTEAGKDKGGADAPPPEGPTMQDEKAKALTARVQARDMLERQGVPAPPQVVSLATTAIRDRARKLAMSETDAAKLVERQIELAKKAGETVNRFWFEDQKHELERKEPRKKPEVVPMAPDAVPDGLDLERGRAALAEFQEAAAKKINRQSYETWLRPLRALGVSDAGVLYVAIPSRAFQHVGERYRDAFEALLPEGIDRVEVLCPATQQAGAA